MSTHTRTSILIDARSNSSVTVDGVKMEMDQDDLAELNLPGRHMFGPMNRAERAYVILALENLLQHARPLVKLFAGLRRCTPSSLRGEGGRDYVILLDTLVSSMEKTVTAVKNKTFSGGLVLAKKVISDYTISLSRDFANCLSE